MVLLFSHRRFFLLEYQSGKHSYNYPEIQAHENSCSVLECEVLQFDHLCMAVT